MVNGRFRDLGITKAPTLNAWVTFSVENSYKEPEKRGGHSSFALPPSSQLTLASGLNPCRFSLHLLSEENHSFLFHFSVDRLNSHEKLFSLCVCWLLSRVWLFVTPWSVHAILQARTLEWVAYPISRGSSRPRRDWIWASAWQANSLPSELPGKPRVEI